MATVRTNKSPLHITCTVGQPYGNTSSSYSCGFHTGMDFPASGTSEANPDVYACVNNGTVVYVYKDCQAQYDSPSLGNQVQILDEETGLYYRYCHLLYGSVSVNVGDKVNTSTKLGKMGTTGNSTGTHLHLEATTTQSWSCSAFLNPGENLGIPNVRGTIVEYDGSIEPEPEPPTPVKNNHGNIWFKSMVKKIVIKY